MTRAVFRAEAAPSLGIGHVMRCRVLADGLAAMGWQTTFAVTKPTVDTVPSLAPHVVVPLASDTDPQELRDRVGACDLLVIDHYGLAAEYETACRDWVNRILVVDDLANRGHDCDLLLDQSPGRTTSDYAGLVPTGCITLVGPAFAVLRPQFVAAARRSLARRRANCAAHRVLVSMGGTDPENVTQTVLRGIELAGLDVALDVVLGRAASNWQAVQTAAASVRLPLELRRDVRDMAALMAEADLAIGAGGTSSFERCCLGLPTLMVVVADNQHHIALALAASGAVELLGEASTMTADRVSEALRRIAGDVAALQAMSRQAAAVCDGRGLARVLMALIPEASSKGASIRFRPATWDDAERMLEWQRQPETRQFARTPEPPSTNEHNTWVRDKLADRDCLFNIVLEDETPVGVLRLDDPDGTGERFVISILVTRDRRGRGNGSATLSLAKRLVPDSTLLADVLPHNLASQRLFERAGFRFTDGFYQFPPATDQTAP